MLPLLKESSLETRSFPFESSRLPQAQITRIPLRRPSSSMPYQLALPRREPIPFHPEIDKLGTHRSTRLAETHLLVLEGNGERW